ncbi:multidrug and toxin extrusion protein 2-like [Gastrophryne carolinensis]
MTSLKGEPKETSPLSGKPPGFRRLIDQLFPEGFCGEAKKQLQLAIPLTLSLLMTLCLMLVSSVFCGHLGKIELDSVMLSASIINITATSFGLGMTSACDTLTSQTYGSKNMKRVGIILQRGILIMMLCCFPCWALLINTEQLLLLCKQNPDVARLTQKYVMIFVPGLPAVFLQQLQSKYLQNQGIIWPQFITGAAANIINAVVNAIFIYIFKLGVVGSAWANTVSQWAMALLLFLYIVGKKLHVETWGGWSKDCLQEWGTFMHLAVASTVMVCIEWWSFEVGGFLAGLLGVVELGGQTILMEIITLAYMLPFGLGAAANIRIGNALGAGDVDQAKKSYKVVLYCAAFCCLVDSSIVVALRDVIGYAFTNDRAVVTFVSHLLLLFGPYHLCDCANAVSGGILRGTGRQKIGAFTNVFGFYFIGLPVGISLMFLTKLQLIENATKYKSSCEGAIVMSHMSSGEGDVKQQEIKDDEPMETTNVIGEILTTKQLIIRRGLALLLSICILVIGIIVKLISTKR